MNQNQYNFIEQQIYSWLSRKSVPSSVRRVSDLPIALATDIGVQRKENQDRLSVLRFKAASDGSEVLLVALADGMGGMIGGADAASIALASFSWGVIRGYGEEVDECLRNAVNYCNKKVFEKYNGLGGTTLSALLINKKGIIKGINVGDSRIYSFTSSSLMQLTEDDTVAVLAQKYKNDDTPVADGFGRELVQYIGQEVPIETHLIDIKNESDRKIIITSDGAHLIGEPNIFKLSRGVSNSAVFAKRVVELANWFGGIDNSSIAVIDTQDISENFNEIDKNIIQLWDPYGELKIACDVAFISYREKKTLTDDMSLPLFSKEEEENLVKKRDSKLKNPIKKNIKPLKKTAANKKEQNQVNINFGIGEKKNEE